MRINPAGGTGIYGSTGGTGTNPMSSVLSQIMQNYGMPSVTGTGGQQPSSPAAPTPASPALASSNRLVGQSPILQNYSINPQTINAAISQGYLDPNLPVNSVDVALELSTFQDYLAGRGPGASQPQRYLRDLAGNFSTAQNTAVTAAQPKGPELASHTGRIAGIPIADYLSLASSHMDPATYAYELGLPQPGGAAAPPTRSIMGPTGPIEVAAGYGGWG